MEESPNGLAKLLTKSIAAKRRRRKPSSVAETTSSADDGALQRENSNVSRSSTTGTTGTVSGGSHHDDREPDDDNHHHHQRSYDAAYDSDPDPDHQDPERAPIRPTAISPHPSQIGYLTTSSPLVQAAHFADSQPSDIQNTTTEPPTPSFTFRRGSVDSTDSAPSLKKGSSNLVAPQVAKRSSGARLREVFRSSKKGSDKGSSDERSPGTTTADSTLGPVPSITKLDAEPQVEPPPADTAFRRPPPAQSNRRLSRGQKIEPLPLSTRPPRTPPSAENVPPVIVNTPPTPTDPNHIERTIPASSRSRAKSDASPAGTMISQRRGRAGSGTLGPSKLSNITSAPLTPTPESGPGPISPGNQAANFFSSVFSAVQNTANTFSNTIANSNLTQPGGGNNRSRPPTSHDQGERDQDSVEVESSSQAMSEQSTDSKEPAVKTLGMGDLSLSQLGIVDPPSNVPTPVAAKFADVESRARAESAPVDVNGSGILPSYEETQYSRPRSLYDTASGDRTPPTGSVYEGKTGGVHRSGSIRSAISRRRKRGSSAATGGTTGSALAAAIAAANASVANPSGGGGSAPKLTGFAVATKKRNRDFHTFFKSVPDDDYLIEDYSCALQREILAHGRLYVSEGHLCFSSNILGWVTTLVMSFDEIVSVEKRSTALVFKNGLEISTLHAKHIFASFTSRDTTYDLIVKIWKLGHPHLQSSLNGVRLDETGGDRTEKIETESVSAIGSHSISGSDEEESSDDDDVYDEDEDKDDGADTTQLSDTPALEAPAERQVARKASGAVGATLGSAEKQDENAQSSTEVDFPGPIAHSPTECGDVAVHYDKVIGDDIVPAPLGKVYNLLFGPASAAWMMKWLSGDQKCTEVTMEDKRGLSDDVKSRTFSYIKPLSGSIGPRQTKCIVTETLENIDLEKSVNVLCSTQNPDVPNGNIFVVKTRYCLTWAEGNATRVQINCTIEWSGKSWLKGAIERGANDGQAQYCKDIFVALKGAVSSRPRALTANGAGGAATKGKKRGRKSRATLASGPASDVESLSKVKSDKQDWGLLEPLRPLLGPVADILKPILTGNVVYGLLVGLLVASWFGFGSRQPLGGVRQDLGYAGYPQRMAAYEEMWRREESELWDWIEERAGLDRLGGGAGAGGRDVGVGKGRKRATEFRTVEEKLREERMDEREVKEAIRVTEEHLKVLKAVVGRESAMREGVSGNGEGNGDGQGEGEAVVDKGDGR
ncbi:hypothetical protein B0T17DRAFT_486007 [Bombardia bombarda]|uniref:VASt domain-containing protein n=1 Tax=Bombardia bombarda TaxID=252184 RepID=A0AA39XP46_9PEZI|nr:hypothetical protein B0T17DRAFT_486007 [Bombardia bombarda]